MKLILRFHSERWKLRRKKRIDRSSIQNYIRKMRKGERYICGIYPSILNCGYRNDRIIFD